MHSLKRACLCLDAQAKKEKKVHLTGLGKIKHDESYLTTGKEFQKLHGHTAKHMDKKIAKEAGLNDMGWMGSKSYIDNKLKVRITSQCIRVNTLDARIQGLYIVHAYVHYHRR